MKTEHWNQYSPGEYARFQEGARLWQRALAWPDDPSGECAGCVAGGKGILPGARAARFGIGVDWQPSLLLSAVHWKPGHAVV